MYNVLYVGRESPFSFLSLKYSGRFGVRGPQAEQDCLGEVDQISSSCALEFGFAPRMMEAGAPGRPEVWEPIVQRDKKGCEELMPDIRLCFMEEVHILGTMSP